jgi:putative hydrolase of the HAD superfamily
MKKIEAILFDFGGTLDHDGMDWFTRLFAILQQENIPATWDDFYTFADQAANAICFMEDTPRLSMAGTVERICEQIYDRFHANNGHGAINWQPKKIAETFIAESQKYLDRNRQILQTLKKQYRLGVISNNWGNTAGWCQQYQLHEYLDTMIDSTVVGSVKPDGGIFQAALREMNLAPGQCVYVGDRYDCDVQGASAAGMLPVWIVGEQGKESGDDSNEVIKIAKLTELLETDFTDV